MAPAPLRDSFLRALVAALEQRNPVVLAVDTCCCAGAVHRSRAGCTCWLPVYDVDQVDPDQDAIDLLGAGIHPNTRKQMCGDCAYRPGSPERAGHDDYAGDAAMLEDLASGGQRFWCHQGMRRPTAWRHPSGATIPTADGDGNYQPPAVDGIPYRADGSPAELCAGWAARHRALSASTPDGGRPC
ncbi:hypothetical protein [Alloactinosynnema sp. L-07]|uniref:hypothetical protein n=1 Tax=Alloactinosynnema sp. L-07 TaxID=1653480 RepID=UPI00065F03E1|nr:hypothetical protein [Alloactinosynnema sp. L-07]CRK59040.1 hypothetical protein [Alloactinosynnema sp. L-07]